MVSEPEHESGSSSLFVTVTIIVRRHPPPSAAPSAVVAVAAGVFTPAKSGLGAPRGAQPIPASHVPRNLCTRRHAPLLFGDLQARVHHAPPSRRRNRAAPPSFVSPEPPGLISALGSLFR